MLLHDLFNAWPELVFDFIHFFSNVSQSLSFVSHLFLVSIQVTSDDEQTLGRFRHMALVWNKSVQNPDAVPYVMRENHYLLDAQRMELMEETYRKSGRKKMQGSYVLSCF